jgi:phosphoglycolate phosphatase
LRQRFEEPLYPGVADAVAALATRSDRMLGVATGKSRRGVARLFDREGWHRHFATIQTADDHPSKPDPSMILKAMAETGAEPRHTVMIGDTSYDMQMARNAGVGAIGVGWGYHDAARLASAGAQSIVDRGQDLLAEIERRLAAQETQA